MDTNYSVGCEEESGGYSVYKENSLELAFEAGSQTAQDFFLIQIHPAHRNINFKKMR